METIGDWGQHLIYSPKFARHHLLDWLPLKTPNDPVFVPFAYACYWTTHSVLLMYLAPKLQQRWKTLTLLQAVVILSIPVNYALDITQEGVCTYLGYWTYGKSKFLGTNGKPLTKTTDPGFGLVIQWPGGGRQPLTWPILLMTGWPNFIAYWAGKPPLYKLNIIERAFQLHRFTEPKPACVMGNVSDEESSEHTPLLLDVSPPKTAGFTVKEFFSSATLRQQHDAQCDYRILIPVWKFELYRFGAWFVTFQISFFVSLVIPLVLLRYISGRGSIYIP